MEILAPLSLHSGTIETAGEPSITILINREVPLNDEQDFLKTLRSLLEDFDDFPGTTGSMVFRREIENKVEFSILHSFASATDHEAWLRSGEFSLWRKKMAPEKPTPDHVHLYSGMEAFFVTATAPDAPPRWKMAIILLIAVYPMSLVMSFWFAPMLQRVPILSGSLLTSVVMVFVMTYILVPILTKCFQHWLQSSQPGKQPVH